MNDENTVFRSLAIIEEKIHGRLTIESLADSLHFSKYHYQRIFREAVGESVMRYVAKRRITLAAEELAQSDENVLEIALKYGYDSHEGFTRSFRAYMGITPTEYRKYHALTGLPQTKIRKEKNAVAYSKATEEIIRELNALIVKAKETAGYIRANGEASSESDLPYSKLWNYIADKTDAMTYKLNEALERVNAIEQCTDEITAMLIIIKTVEYAVFQSDTVSFQAGLMISRVKKEERELFKPVINKLHSLSHNAVIKLCGITKFFNELSSLIFEDMRARARQKILQAAEAGRAVNELSAESDDFPFTYITESISEITRELVSTPLEDITVELLEDYASRLEIISFSADLDSIGAFPDKELFTGISVFKERIMAAAEFFGSLSDDVIQAFEHPRKPQIVSPKKHCDYAFRENMLLFYLKGEREKLDPYLTPDQKSVFDGVFNKINIVIRLVNRSHTVHEDTVLIMEREIEKIMTEVYEAVTRESEKLGDYGDSLRYIAEELRLCGIYRRTVFLN